jgi:hypothetical protein
MRIRLTLTLSSVAALTATAALSNAFSLSDIESWAGAGDNRAALVVDWSAPEVRNNTSVPDPVQNLTLGWGFRFSGSATASDMVSAIAANDPRLYIVTGYGGGALFGIGYDLNGDGEFGLTDGTTTYSGEQIKTGAANDFNADAFRTTDGGDLYWGGSLGPNWEQWTEAGAAGGFENEPDRGTDQYWTPVDPDNPWAGSHGEWALAQEGIQTMALEDGSWLGLSVARGGLEWMNPDAPGTIAYNLHKQAPGPASATPVPEPATLAGLIFGGFALLRSKRRTK